MKYILGSWASLTSLGFDDIPAALPKGSVKSDFIGPNTVSSRSSSQWEDVSSSFFGRGNLDSGVDGGEEEGKIEVDDNDEDGQGGGDVVGGYPNAMVDDARSEADIRLKEYKKEVARREEILKAQKGGEGKQRRKKNGEGEERSRRK